MSLNFPNTSRSFDAARQSVCFWGYDSAFEISFYISMDVLRSISSQPQGGEDASLHAFDANRERIRKAASKMYGKRRQSFYVLTAPDL